MKVSKCLATLMGLRLITRRLPAGAETGTCGRPGAGRGYRLGLPVLGDG